jgi:hypothetical protein
MYGLRIVFHFCISRFHNSGDRAPRLAGAGYALGIAAAICVIALSLAGAQSAHAQAATTAPNSATGMQAVTPQGDASKRAGGIGKRQPRRGDVPEGTDNFEQTAEDRALNRRLRSICKGC